MSVIHARIREIAPWSPLVFLLLGVVLVAFWAFGTSVQVLTSEALFANLSTIDMSFNAWGQLIDFCRGQLDPELLMPFTYAWGVQLALIVSSVGIELPRRPAWRFWSAWILTVALLLINTCGDYAGAASYGWWQQIAFTVVVLFLTFYVGLLAITCFMHAWYLFQKDNHH